jgi:hypothetical protein
MLTPRQIFEELQHYYQVGYNHLTFETQGRINDLAQNILMSIGSDKFNPTREETRALLTCSPGLANLVAMSSFETTDHTLDYLRLENGVWRQLMILTSVRNTLQTDPKVFFDHDQELASLWYEMFLVPAAGRTSELLYNNTVAHLKALDVRYTPSKRATTLYFIPDYIDSELVAPIKRHIAWALSDQADQVWMYPAGEGAPKSIAVVSDNWRPGHAVYKSMYPLIEALTLVTSSDSYCQKLFHEVRRVAFRDGRLDVGELQDNNFNLALFLDVGMTPESIMLAAHTIAPTQVACHGHPSSTRSLKMDYFLSGAGVEKTYLWNAHYSERALLTNGSGNLGLVPDGPRPPAPLATGSPTIINIPWGVAKYNYPMLQILRGIQATSTLPIRYHFFPGGGLDRYNCANPFFRDMARMFGSGAEYFPNQPYDAHLKSLAKGTIALDNYPFGGYNSVIDSLWSGIPIVTLEGDQWYNRVGSYLLKKAQLHDLVAHSVEEYVRITLRLVADSEFYASMAHKVQSIRFERLLDSRGETRDFVALIQGLL